VRVAIAFVIATVSMPVMQAKADYTLLGLGGLSCGSYLPVKSGEIWSTALERIGLASIRLQFN
jgi:hypothetical protein